MIAVTGMHRSGTSCITGLLVRCGFSMGDSHPLLNEQRFDNPKGHHENLGVLAINENILRQVGGSWLSFPHPESINATGEMFSPYISEFTSCFNGDLFKDPRICLTVRLWEKYCQALTGIVFCLRSPIGVAASLRRRNQIPLSDGLKLWYEYNVRFLQGIESIPVHVIDYDSLGTDPVPVLTTLASRLGRPMGPGQIRRSIEGFYEKTLNHDPTTTEQCRLLPQEIYKLYTLIKEQAITSQTESELIRVA